MNARLSSALAIATLTGYAFAQDMSKKITFSAPATRASVLFHSLSQTTGIRLLTTPQTENEVLLIQVQDVSVKDLFDRIAKVTNDAWRKEAGGYRLVPSPALSRKASIQEAERRVEIFRKGLALELESQKSATAWSPERAAALAQSVQALVGDPSKRQEDPQAYRKGLNALRDQLPTTNAIDELLGQIGASNLAHLDPTQRAVFALHPNAMQLPMTGDSAKIVEQFVQHQKQFADAYAQLGGVSNPNMLGPDSPAPTKEQGNFSLGVGQAILVVTQTAVTMYGPGIGMQVNLIVADTKGATLASGSKVIFRPVELNESSAAPVKSDPIVLDPLAKEFASVANGRSFLAGSDEYPTMISHVKGVSDPVTFYSWLDQGNNTKKLSDELKARMMHPEDFDPFSILIGPCLSTAAKYTNKNLVADLPDPAFQPLTQVFSFPGNVIGIADFLNQDCARASLEVQQSDKWLTIAPINRDEAENRRVNRVVLGNLLRSFEKNQTADLNEVATFALKQSKKVSVGDIDGIYLQTAAGSLGRKALSTLQNTDILRIYATLTHAERTAMEANGTIPVMQLTPDQKGWLADDVFNSLDGPQFEQEGPPIPAGFNGRRGPSNTSLQKERTQLFSEGIDRSSTLAFQYSEDKGLYGQSNKLGLAGFLTFSDLAGRLFQKEKPQLGKAIEYETFQSAVRQRMSFHFELGNGADLTRSLESASVDPNSKAVAFADLPTDAKQRVNDILDMIRQSPIATMNIGSPGRARRFTTPPPNE